MDEEQVVGYINLISTSLKAAPRFEKVTNTSEFSYFGKWLWTPKKDCQFELLFYEIVANKELGYEFAWRVPNKGSIRWELSFVGLLAFIEEFKRELKCQN